MTDSHTTWGGPQEYTDAFLRSARRAVRDLCERRGAEFESLTHDAAPDAAGDMIVAATAVVRFRGHRCAFRRGIWPPSHPATTRAAIYATVLEERLLTRVHPLPDDGTSTLDL
ncbi:hypothetical protein ADK57_42305 [Streptomyces sp. MMG1533]|uniref:hypothetical protein n=1 Tax=Streptomyces sp. MMG1533 TaxID=1415546 RepID=UPI0006AFAF60|nr:hypothetical protein [Streptomyces sp. MMG1533]KOU56427.1 hypothetical protein ADK57_42305 [Streptomyces sp. MMG1533]